MFPKLLGAYLCKAGLPPSKQRAKACLPLLAAFTFNISKPPLFCCNCISTACSSKILFAAGVA